MTQQVPLFINGGFITSKSTHKKTVLNPASQQVLAEIPFATPEEIEDAVASARQAFQLWRNVPIPERARLMLRYQALLKIHHDEPV